MNTEPVYIDFELRSNVAEEANKATTSVEELARTSIESRKQTRDALEMEKAVMKELNATLLEQKQILSELEQKKKSGGSSVIDNQIKSAKGEIAAITDAIKEQQSNVDAAEKALDKLNNTYGELARRQRGLKAEMQELIAAGKGNTQEYHTLRKELEELSRATRIVNEESSRLGHGRSWDGMVQGLQGLVGSMSALQGAYFALGGSADNYAQAQVRLQSAIALVVGIQQVQMSLAKGSAFQTQVVAKGTQMWATATTRLAAAMKISTAAAKALSIVITGGLIVGLTFVVNIIGKITDRIRQQQKDTQKLADATSNHLASQMATWGKLNVMYEELKANGGDVSRLLSENKSDFEQLGVSISNTSQIEHLFNEGKIEFEEALKYRAMAIAKMELATERYKEAITKMIEHEKRGVKPTFWQNVMESISSTDGSERISSKDMAQVSYEQKSKAIQQELRDNLALIEDAWDDESVWNNFTKKSGLAAQNKLASASKTVVDYAQQLASLQKSIEEELSTSIIAQMQEGTARELAVLDARNKSRIDKIKECEGKLNDLESKSKIDVSKQRGLLRELELEQQKEYEVERQRIMEASQKVIQELEKELNSNFLTDKERRLEDLENYYNQMIAVVKEKVPTIEEQNETINEIELARMKERSKLLREFELKDLAFQEQIANRRAEIANQRGGFKLDTDREQYKLNIQLEGVEKRISQLEKMAEAGDDVAEALEDARVEQERLNGEIAKIPLKRVQELGDAVKGIFGSMSKLGGIMGEVFGELSNRVDDVLKLMDDTLSLPERIGAGISGLVDLVGMAMNQARENAEAEARFASLIENAYHRAALARIEALKYKPSNIFGVDNPFAQVIAGANQYRSAMEELSATIDRMGEGQIQVGTKKVVSGKNIAKGAGAGAAAGAAIGSFIPVIGNAIGAGIGAVIGGLFGATQRKVVPIFNSLISQFGSVLKSGSKTFELNPKIIENYAKLDDATKKLVDNWEQIREKALEAEKQMEDSFRQLAGDLGGMLSQSLADGFRSNDIEAALREFDGKVSEVIMQIIEQQLFATYFKEHFDALTEGMKASFSVGGDGDIIDDIKKFVRDYRQNLDAYEDAIREAESELEAQGFEMDSKREAVEKRGLAQASQDSINELMGISTNQLLQLRLLVEFEKKKELQDRTQFMLLQSMARNVEIIASNSVFLRRLETIDQFLNKMDREGILLKG